MIHLPEKQGDVVLIDGVCYQFAGFGPGEVTPGAVVEAMFDTCDQCELGSSALEEISSGVEEISSALEESSSRVDDISSSSALEEESLDQIEDCSACNCTAPSVTATLTFIPTCSPFCDPAVTNEPITLSLVSPCRYENTPGANPNWPESIKLFCNGTPEWEIEIDIGAGACIAGAGPPPGGAVVALDCTSGKPLGTVAVPIETFSGNCGTMTIVFS
jgi:hypothetical protein